MAANEADAHELLVRVPRGAASAAAHAALTRRIEEVAGPIVERCGVVGDAVVYRILTREPPAFELAGLKALGVATQPNLLYEQHRTPNDDRFSEQWSLENSGSGGGKAGADIKASQAWANANGSASVVIGVVDTGVDLDHPDLAPNLWNNPDETPTNGLDDDHNGYIDDTSGLDAVLLDPASPVLTPLPAGKPQDVHGYSHGTSVASIAAAVTDNHIGIAGVAWKASVVPCRMHDDDVEACTCRTIKCLDYLRGLKTEKKLNLVAVNFSYGSHPFDPLVHDAIADLAAEGILFVASAGNDGANTDCTPHYPSSYALPNIIAVAATTDQDALSSSSNCGGASVHLAAPGEQIVALEGGVGQEVNAHTLSGTSMAAPHVTGLLALLAARDVADDTVAWDWRALRNRVLAGGDEIGATRLHTISQRRLRAAEQPCTPGRPCAGALTCVEQYVHRRLLPRNSYELASGGRVALVEKGKHVTLAALSINCEKADPPVTVRIKSSTPPYLHTVTLVDADALPEFAKDDGIFAATWTPPDDVTDVTLDYFYGQGGIPDMVGGFNFDHIALRVVDTPLPAAASCLCPP